VALEAAVSVGTQVITGVTVLALVHVCYPHHQHTHTHRLLGAQTYYVHFLTKLRFWYTAPSIFPSSDKL